MTLSARTALGHYEVISFIGAGGMGEVYRARDTRLGREVALKILPDAFASDPDRLVRFEREARVLAALNHPNIATLHGVEESGHVKALVLELVDGSTLAELVAHGALPLSQALAIAEQVAEAVEAAHAAGVVHRDLKPANIKVQNSRVKVLDFGLAKAMDVAEPQARLSNSPTMTTPAGTRYGVVLGTAAYMAPEQARGEPVDEQADIWAFGCVLFEALTGRPVFEGRSVSDIIAAILRGEPDWSLLPPQLHPRVRLLLERCLDKDKASRYHSIADARVDLQRAIADPNGAATPVRRAHAYSVTWYWVAAVAALSAIAGIVIWSQRAPRDLAVLRYSDVLPPDRAFTNAGHPLVAISPDGSSLAYPANRQLFVRSQDRVEAVPIAGTDGSPSTPFFSPDGRFVGYFDFLAGELRRIPVAGGTPVGLVKVTNVFGARWNTDDTIVYGADTGIWKISATGGGTPEQLVRLDGGARAHAPQLLPGGEWVLFTLRSGVGSSLWDQSQVVVQSVRTGERKVIRTGRDVRYLPTGHIVYAMGSTLFAIGFDSGRLEAIGAPIPVVEGIRLSSVFPGMTGSANYDVSASGVLAYVRGQPQPPTLRQLVAVDRKGVAEPLVTERRDYWRPRVSPDGTRVAVEVVDDRGEHVWTVNLADGNASPLEVDSLRSVFSTWTPDGEFVIFRLDSSDDYGIYQAPADGSAAPRLLYGATEDLMPGDVSRDGILVFAAGEQTGRRSIWTMPITGSQATPFLDTPHLEHMPVFSSDGKWIAYASNETGRSEIYVRPYPSSAAPARTISEAGRYSTALVTGRYGAVLSEPGRRFGRGSDAKWCAGRSRAGTIQGSRAVSHIRQCGGLRHRAEWSAVHYGHGARQSASRSRADHRRRQLARGAEAPRAAIALKVKYECIDRSPSLSRRSPRIGHVAADARAIAGTSGVSRQWAQSDHAHRFRRRAIARVLSGTIRDAGAGAARVGGAAQDGQRTEIPRTASGGKWRASKHQRARIWRAGFFDRRRDQDARCSWHHHCPIDCRQARAEAGGRAHAPAERRRVAGWQHARPVCRRSERRGLPTSRRQLLWRQRRAGQYVSGLAALAKAGTHRSEGHESLHDCGK
jgi:serine/threonine-protein kinase